MMKNAKHGEAHPKCKLTESKVNMMRSQHECFSWGYKRLSKCFGVSIRTVRDIVSYRTWCN
jgi:hypothetical protein